MLVADPSASLADVARAAGIGRTALHELHPTRHALLVALARDALDVLERTCADAGPGGPETDADPAAALRRPVVALVPLGPRVEHLVRERSLDVEPDLTAPVEALDEPVRALVRRAQATGQLRAGVPDEWVVASLNALVHVAWELVALDPAGAGGRPGPRAGQAARRHPRGGGLTWASWARSSTAPAPPPATASCACSSLPATRPHSRCGDRTRS